MGMSEQDDIVTRIVAHRLAQDDIKKILDELAPNARDAFITRLSETLSRTSALLQVAKEVSDTLSLDILLPRMVELVCGFLNADRATIFLFDRENKELYSRVARGAGMSEIRFPSHLGIAGSVFSSGTPVNIPDAYQDSRFNPEFDKKTGYRTTTILCAPIHDPRGAAIGVTQVLNKNHGLFDDTDMDLLQAVTSQAASALMNAQLHEEIERARKEEAQLLEVTTAISTELHLEPLLRKIMETVTTILDADRSTLFLYDAKPKQLWSRVAQGLGTQEIRFPSHLGIAGAVFTTGQTINIPDAYADARFNKEIDKKTGYKTDTILCMPVQNKQGQTIGVTQVLNKRGGPFGPMDERRLRAFSSQASIALENARLFEDILEVKNYNESILQSMSNGVITLDAEANIVKANDAALRLFRAEKTPEEMLGRKAVDVFGERNGWVLESIRRVVESRKPDTAMDTEIKLRDDAVPEHDRRRGAAAVNLSTVPLFNIKGEPLGCMMVIEDITKEKRLKGTMARYMTKEVADKLLEEGGEAALGGTLLKASVLFSDIRSFTSISERIGAQETVKLLNEYFTLMVDIILEGGGMLDKFIGDAIMAVFGAPFPTPNDADNAVKAAIGMLRACHDFNRRRATMGQDPVYMGLGINTDDVLAGNIGSLKRMDYTVIGDGVNLASRLEGTNKPYGTQIIISEFTVRELKAQYQLRELDRIRVKGKSEPVGIYEVLDHHDEETLPNRTELLYMFNAALAYYKQREWAQAERIFNDALLMNRKDGPSAMYRDRCKYFLEHPPAADWDGVWTMKTK